MPDERQLFSGVSEFIILEFIFNQLIGFSLDISEKGLTTCLRSIIHSFVLLVQFVIAVVTTPLNLTIVVLSVIQAKIEQWLVSSF